jgi:hypothetical protein
LAYFRRGTDGGEEVKSSGVQEFRSSGVQEFNWILSGALGFCNS